MGGSTPSRGEGSPREVLLSSGCSPANEDLDGGQDGGSLRGIVTQERFVHPRLV